MGETLDLKALVRFVADGLARRGDPERARQIAAYLKTEMPVFGVQKPGRVEVFREMYQRFPPESQEAYRTAVEALWAQPHREEKHAALAYAERFKRFITLDALPLYERLIREGAWWDLVDTVASKLINPLMKRHRDALRPVMDAWIDDADIWIRRAAILSQLKLKGATDADMLFGYCLRRADETSFWIRKAIGWALRQYSYTAPEAVRDFLAENRDALSGLSYREGKKQLVRMGLM